MLSKLRGLTRRIENQHNVMVRSSTSLIAFAKFSAKEGGLIHTEFHVTVFSRLGYVTATAFPCREDAERFMASERKKKNVAKVTMDTMLASDAMDRFQLRPLTRKEDDR